MEDGIQEIQTQELSEDESSWEVQTGSTDLSDEEDCYTSSEEEYGDEARYTLKRSRRVVP